jgi:hypothetical protein
MPHGANLGTCPERNSVAERVSLECEKRTAGPVTALPLSLLTVLRTSALQR